MNNTENNTNNTVPTNTVPTNTGAGSQPNSVVNQMTGATNVVQNPVSGVSNQNAGVVNGNSGVVGVNTTTDSNVSPVSPNLGDASAGATQAEKLKKVEINYTPPSKTKTVLTFLIFILIIGFVVFLPEITTAINQYKASKNEIKDEVITTGKLECELNSNTTNLDVNYLRVFKFTDSKLNEAEYTVTTRGDATLDEQTLNDMANKCTLLQTHTSSTSGVEVKCTYSEGKLVENQSFKFASIDLDELDAAFSEAGGTYPEFKNEQEIDSIEKNMNAAGYSCIRKK